MCWGLDRSPSESGVCTGGVVGLVCAGGLVGGGGLVGFLLPRRGLQFMRPPQVKQLRRRWFTCHRLRSPHKKKLACVRTYLKTSHLLCPFVPYSPTILYYFMFSSHYIYNLIPDVATFCIFTPFCLFFATHTTLSILPSILSFHTSILPS